MFQSRLSKNQNLVCFLICCAFLYLLVRNYAFSVLPLSDDLSMIAFSQSWSSEWFSKGLADYFIVYPEYYEPQSNFIRPVSNIAFWFFSWIMPDHSVIGANRLQLLIVNYGTLAAIATILFSETRLITGSLWLGIVAALFALFIPSFWTTPTPTYTSFVFDELATLLCLCAFIAARHKRSINASLWLTLALLTKEIAFPVAIAFGIYFILNRRIGGLVALIIGGAVWAVLRLNAFGLHSEGVYVFSDTPIDLKTWLISKLQNIFTLPIGPVFFDNLWPISFSSIQAMNFSPILLVLNCLFLLIFFGMLGKDILRVFRTRRLSASSRAEANTHLAALTSFFTFLFVAYVGANYRYAFVFLPFFFLYFVGGIQRHKIRGALIALLAVSAVTASAPSILRLNAGNSFEAYRYRIMAALFDKLEHHDRARRLFIFNDSVSGYANPHALEILSVHDSKIERGSSLYLDNCARDEIKNIKTQITTTDQSLRIETVLPECARFAFESSPKIYSFVAGQILKRNDHIFYELDPQNDYSRSNDKSDWLGRRLTAVVSRSADADVLYFDFMRDDWILINQDFLNTSNQ